MNIFSTTTVVAVLSVAAAVDACSPGAPPAPEVRVENAWARPSRIVAPHAGEAETITGADATSAVYLTLRNEGRRADTLVGARTDIARTIEIHESRIDEGVMRMRQMGQGVEIPARGSVMLKPGGTHLMLIGLTQHLIAGEEFVVTLELSESGDQTVEVLVGGSE